MKGLLLTIFVSAAFYIGLHSRFYEPAFCFVLGVFFPFFADIEGSHRYRVWGMLSALALAVGVSVICLAAMIYLPYWLYIAVASGLIFLSSMLAAYGFRGAMVAFAGLFAVILSFSYMKFSLPPTFIIINYLAGGLSFTLVAGIVQYVYQNRHAELQLAEAFDLTADLFEKKQEGNREIAGDKIPKEQKELLQLQTKLIDKHEVLRSIIMDQAARKTLSPRRRRLYQLFVELINSYEDLLAKTVPTTHKNIDFGQFLDKNKADYVQGLRHIAAALRYRRPIENRAIWEEKWQEFSRQLESMVESLPLPEGREARIYLRNVQWYQQRQWERLGYMQQTVNSLSQLEQLKNVPEAALFVTDEDYSPQILKDNMSMKSPIFRHALRLTAAVVVGFFIGHLLEHEYTNWIVVTIVVIIRPHYGLTKHRMIDRFSGTLLGVVLVALVLWYFKSRYVYGAVAIGSMLVGYTVIQKKYWLAATGITMSILLLYALIDNASFDMLTLRLTDTFIGALISFVAVTALWPTREVAGIRDIIANAIDANLVYITEVVDLYWHKSSPDLGFKLSRKEAFLYNSQLNAAYQRMSEEPASGHLRSVFSLVMLNQTLLYSIASLSAYTQNRPTSPASNHFTLIVHYIYQALERSLAALRILEPPAMVEKADMKAARDELISKYEQLVAVRNNQLREGETVISEEMRNQLLEFNYILSQLDWMVHLAELIEKESVKFVSTVSLRKLN